MNKLCSKCNKSKYIMNKTYNLCTECNQIRKYGKTKFQINIEKSKNKQKKYNLIKNKSKKQIGIDAKYKDTIEKISETRPKICTGCNSSNVVLSHSHIISRKDCKAFGFTELIYNENNITYHCLDFEGSNGCHKRWENPKKRKELFDYVKNILYISSISKELYNKYKV